MIKTLEKHLLDNSNITLTEMRADIERVYGYDKRSTEVEKAKQWLQGLPNDVNIEFENYNILQLMDTKEDIEGLIVDLYWDIMATIVAYKPE